MFKSLEELFKHYLKRDFDLSLYHDIKLFRLNWAQKDNDYIEFLGGNTLGIQAIRFSIKDDEEFVSDTLGIDLNELTFSLCNTKGITKGRAAECNAVFQILIYLMHGFMKSNKLKLKDKQDALNECYYIFAYKKFSSLMFHYFKFPTDESIAKAAYEKMSNKYLIKKLNSWQKVFEYRAKDVHIGNIHHKRLMDYSTEDAIRVLLDLQTKLNDMFKNVYALIIEVYNNNERIVSDTLVSNLDGEEKLVEIANAPDKHIRYIKSIINSNTDFVKYDLVNLISSQLSKGSTSLFYNFLTIVSSMDKKILDKIADISILQGIEILATKGIANNYDKHILDVMNILKLHFSNTKNNNRELEKLKTVLEKEFIKNFPKSKYVAPSASVCVLVYTFVRCLYNV